MANKLLKATLVAILTLVYNYFFWQEKLGLNLVLFSILIVATWLVIMPKNLKNKFVWVSLSGVLISGVAVLVFNTTISKVAHIISMAIMAGFVHRNEFKSVINALMEVLVSFYTVFFKIVEIFKSVLKRATSGSKILTRFFSYLKLAFIPIVIFIIFFVIFNIANPIFRDITTNIFERAIDAFLDFIESLSFPRLSFIAMGLYITSILIIGGKTIYSRNKEKRNNKLNRTRRPEPAHTNPIALKNEHKIALMVIVSVNVLFLIVNIIDIKWLWLSGNPGSSNNWSTLVHEGTNMLILSIILAMGILLYYFNGNLNFYKKVKILRQASYVWIFQNAILSISVALRSFYYIQVHGLAYKRIGVIIFLMLAVFGLITFFIKIKKIKSVYYLLRMNSWAAFTMLIIMSTINWDTWIVKHNFNHTQLNTGEIDIDYMISRADRTLVLVDKNKDKIDMLVTFNTIYGRGGKRAYTREDYFIERKEKFIRNYESKSWLSWNLADRQTYDYFKSVQ